MRNVTLSDFNIRIHEPLAETLNGSPGEIDFELSLLDVARFSGHCCVAVTGAFLVTKAAIEKLFPDGVCVRGDVQVDLPSETTPAAKGPVANVISYITGAWGDNGFKGLSGKHVRKDLLRLNSSQVSPHSFLFKRISTGATTIVRFSPQNAAANIPPESPFAERIKMMVHNLLSNPKEFVEVSS